MLNHQCTGGPSAPIWCGLAATLVASNIFRMAWFCCPAHTEGDPSEPIADWYRRYVLPGYDGSGRVRECDVCGNHQICDKYSDWTCGNCKQNYDYSETEPNLRLTDAQRELLRAAFEASK